MAFYLKIIDFRKAVIYAGQKLQGVPKKRGIKNFKFLTQYLGLQTVLRKVFVLKIKLRACTF